MAVDARAGDFLFNHAFARLAVDGTFCRVVGDVHVCAAYSADGCIQLRLLRGDVWGCVYGVFGTDSFLFDWVVWNFKILNSLV